MQLEIACDQCCHAMQEIANDILGEQTPKRLFAVRGKLYELLVNCIPPELIIKKLMVELARKLDDELKHKVADCAAFFEHRLQARTHFLPCLSKPALLAASPAVGAVALAYK